MQAVSKGLQVQSWLENLPTDEMPPQEIWHHGERLDAWFKDVKANREKKYAPNGDQYEQVPDGETVEFDVSEDVRELRGY